MQENLKVMVLFKGQAPLQSNLLAMTRMSRRERRGRITKVSSELCTYLYLCMYISKATRGWQWYQELFFQYEMCNCRRKSNHPEIQIFELGSIYVFCTLFWYVDCLHYVLTLSSNFILMAIVSHHFILKILFVYPCFQ